jgi:hypothetical protein
VYLFLEISIELARLIPRVGNKSKFFLALFNASDNYYQQALSVLNKLDRPLITTSPVITETCYLLISRGGGIQSECNFTPSAGVG